MQHAVQYSPYTDSPHEGSFVVFPSHAHQILSNFIQILGASLLAYCFARRTVNENLGSRSGWVNLTWAKLWVILLFFDSWIFLVFSGILISGVGLSYSVPTCSLGVYACIVFYAGSKALIYLFLVERVWIVWNAGNSITRRQSFVYKFLMLVIMGYLVIFILLLVGRIALIRSDGSCVIGLRNFASLPLLSYDLFVNILLTSMFIWPLKRDRHTNQRLRLLAWRTLAAAAVALTTSSVNIAILAVVGGKQLGWVCLGSCAADVTVNALVIFWVTAGAHREAIDRLPQKAVANGRKVRIAAGALSLTIPQLDVAPSFVRQEDGITFDNGDTLDLDSGIRRDVSVDDDYEHVVGFGLVEEEALSLSKECDDDADSIVDIEAGRTVSKGSRGIPVHEFRTVSIEASADGVNLNHQQQSPQDVSAARVKSWSGRSRDSNHSPTSSRSRFSASISSILNLGRSRSSTPCHLAPSPSSPVNVNARGPSPLGPQCTIAGHDHLTHLSTVYDSACGAPTVAVVGETSPCGGTRNAVLGADEDRPPTLVIPERALTIPTNLHASSSSSSFFPISSASPSLTTTLHVSPSDPSPWSSPHHVDEFTSLTSEAGPSRPRLRNSSLRSSRHLQVLRQYQHERSRSTPPVTSDDIIHDPDATDTVYDDEAPHALACPFCAQNVPGRPADWRCPHGTKDQRCLLIFAGNPDAPVESGWDPHIESHSRSRIDSLRKARSCPKSLRSSNLDFPYYDEEDREFANGAANIRGSPDTSSRQNNLTPQSPSSHLPHASSRPTGLH